MTSFREFGAGAVALAASFLVLVASNAAEAQSDADGAAREPEWEFRLTPYLWAAGQKGDVATLPNLPTVEIDESFSDILEDLEFGAMLFGQARRDRLILFADVAYIAVSSDSDTPGPLFSSVELDTDTLFGGLGAGYRVLDDRAWLDIGGGLRFWRVKTELEFEAGVLPARSTDESESWADPLITLRGGVDLGSGFSLVGYADVGGFGVASHNTWQLMGVLNYRFSDRISGVAGYRHLSVDYENDGFVWDVDLSGPILGVTFRF